MYTRINRHHPITLFYRMYRTIRTLIIPVAIAVFNEIKAEHIGNPYWTYIYAGIFTAIIFGWAVLVWYRDTYFIDQEKLHVKHGVFTITERTIPLEKINSLEHSQNWLYRFLGVVKVEVRTADSDQKADAKLILSKRKMQSLQLLKQNVDALRTPTDYEYRHVVTNKELFMMSISSHLFWLGVPFVMTIAQYVIEWLDPSAKESEMSYTKLFSKETWASIDFTLLTYEGLLLIGLCVIVSWFFSLIVIQIKFKDWVVERKGNLIQIQFGFLERKVIQLDVKKIQSLRIKDKLWSRFFGYSSLWIDCVSFDGEHRLKFMIPAIRKTELPELIANLLPEFRWTENLNPLQKGAKPYYVLYIPILWSVIIILASLMYFPLLIALVLPLCILVYKAKVVSHMKWGIHHNQLVISKEGFTKTTVYLLRNATESITHEQSWLQKYFRIHSIKADIDSPSSSSEYRLTGISEDEVGQILKWYKKKNETLVLIDEKIS